MAYLTFSMCRAGWTKGTSESGGHLPTPGSPACHPRSVRFGALPGFFRTQVREIGWRGFDSHCLHERLLAVLSRPCSQRVGSARLGDRIGSCQTNFGPNPKAYRRMEGLLRVAGMDMIACRRPCSREFHRPCWDSGLSTRWYCLRSPRSTRASGGRPSTPAHRGDADARRQGQPHAAGQPCAVKAEHRDAGLAAEERTLDF
jgi:hypothetical protein